MLSASTEKIEVWDVVIIGGGVAGLYTALLAAESGKNILLLAKTELDESNTQEAQELLLQFQSRILPLHLLDTFSAVPAFVITKQCAL